MRVCARALQAGATQHDISTPLSIFLSFAPLLCRFPYVTRARSTESQVALEEEDEALAKEGVLFMLSYAC